MGAVAAGESQRYESLASVAAHQLSGVTGLHVLVHIGGSSFHVVVVHPRGVTIECQADGVEDGGLAGTGFAGDEKHFTVGKRMRLEVDHRILYGSNVMYGKFLYFHALCFLCLIKGLGCPVVSRRVPG